MKKDNELKERVSELEHELAVKEAELHRYRLELGKANETLEKMIAQMTQEIAFAQILQKKLSPTTLPHIPGFEFSTKFIPGTRFGGDYFEIFEHEDKLKFGILISSASGYTLSSLLLSMIIKMSSQMEARRGLAPHKMIQLLAQSVAPNIQTSDTASLFYGVIDRRNYELEYCSVGNIEALLQVHGKEGLVELSPTGPSLAKDFNTELKSRSMALNSRDRLVFATEGLRWGPHGLADTFQRAPRQGVHELRNEILFANEKHSGKTDPVRDQTLIVTEVKERVIKLAES